GGGGAAGPLADFRLPAADSSHTIDDAVLQSNPTEGSTMRLRRTAWAALMLAAAAAAALPLGCSKAIDPWQGQPGPPRVVVSFAPLYSFTRAVGGDHVGVICLATKSGPHHYEGSATHALALPKADLFLPPGLGLDRYVENIKANGGNKDLPLVLLGEKLDKQLLLKDESGNEIDPHVWLGISQAKAMVNQIAVELGRVDAANRAEYIENAQKY